MAGAANVVDRIQDRGIVAMAEVKVSRKFVADFETVATRYKLLELGEYADAKEAARRDIEAAQEAFAAIAAEIRKGQA